MNIAVLISGGVDSSVALKLLKDQGHKVTAFYLKIWLEDELAFLGSCPWQEDLKYAQAVCDQLNVHLNIIPFQKEYWDRVVSYTISQAKEGKTPNPDVLCNQHIKFGAFLDYIGTTFDKVASGHYGCIMLKNGHYVLSQAPDAIKDQTYFLSSLTQDQLSRLLLPLGNMTKEEVRAYAQKHNLAPANRKDSQGICFLGKISYPEFLRYHLGQKNGDLIEYETKKIVGTHKGYWFYTIGQRQGIRLANGPWYVVSKDIERNIVYISRNYYDDNKKRDTFLISNTNWLNGKKPVDGSYKIKLRHGNAMHNCQLRWLNKNDTAKIILSDQDQGIASGQFAVLYAENECLGNGVII